MNRRPQFVDLAVVRATDTTLDPTAHRCRKKYEPTPPGRLATPTVAALQPETALDAREAATPEIGTIILRRLLHTQWAEIDAALVAQHCTLVAPAVVHQDGQETVTVASRFGLLHLNRQVCVDPHTQSHTLPSNAVLLPHGGDDHHTGLTGVVLSVAAGVGL